MTTNHSVESFDELIDLPDDLDQLSVIDEVRLIGRFVFGLAGRSVLRLALIFVTVFFASFLSSTLLILVLTASTQVYTRGALFVIVVICLIPIGATMAFNYVAYRGLREVVEKLGFGQKIGAGLVAYLEPTDRMRLPLTDFTGQIRGYLTQPRQEAKSELRGVKGLFLRGVNRAIFYTARIVLNRIAEGCVVDGEVDLERFAVAIGERADEMLVSYFKKLLWDLARIVVGIAILVLWLLIILVTQLVNLFS